MSDDDFIGLPPGILPVAPDTDSGTVRRERNERPRPERSEIVFFSAGAAPAVAQPVAEPEPVPVAPAEPIAPIDRAAVESGTVESRTVVSGTPASPPPEPLIAASQPDVEPIAAPLGAHAATPVAPPTPAPVPAAGFEDETRLTPPRHGAPSWRLTIAGHGQVIIDSTLFLGRNPVASPDHVGAHVLAIDDAAKSVSKTHAMLELADGLLWVHDLESTNGVWVVPAGDEPIEVTPGTKVVVPPGADLEIGDVVIQVEHS